MKFGNMDLPINKGKGNHCALLAVHEITSDLYSDLTSNLE